MVGEKVADLGHTKNGPFSQQCSCPISPRLCRAPCCTLSSSVGVCLPHPEQYEDKSALLPTFPSSYSASLILHFLPGQTVKLKTVHKMSPSIL